MKTYKCAQCGGVFEKGRSDAEADAEALNLWGVAKASEHPEMAQICDDCFREFRAWLASKERQTH